MRPDPRPEWAWALALVVGVLAWSWLGARPVLADVLRTEAETGTGGSVYNWASYSGGQARSVSAAGVTAAVTFTVPAGSTSVLRAYGYYDGGSAGKAKIDSDSYTNFSGSGSGAQILRWTSGTIAAGSHTFTWESINGVDATIDYIEQTTTLDPTTTTTEPPTTTTTEPPTTTTTVPPTTTTTAGDGVPASLSDDPTALPVSSMLAIGGLFAGLSTGSVLTRLMRP